MPLAVADLVDATSNAAACAASRQPIGDRALDDGRHAFPVQAEMMGGFAPTQMLVRAATDAASAPLTRAHGSAQGNRFRAHSATLALDPPRR